MTYPEKGASYKNNPKWLEEAKRAEGGRIHLTAGAATGEGRLQKAEMQKESEGRASGGSVNPATDKPKGPLSPAPGTFGTINTANGPTRVYIPTKEEANESAGDAGK